MHYEDRISIATPEGLDLDLTLAGLGSRFTAGLLDSLIQGAILLALYILLSLGSGAAVLAGPDDVPGGVVAVVAALLIVLIFLILFGYHVAFEMWASGRTPGKRWTGLRVVRLGGGPVTFIPSAVRNILRLVDFLPSFYGAGILAILVTNKNQRLGDLAAGTLVVQEGRSPSPVPQAFPHAAAPGPGGFASPALAWDVSAVTAEELATVRRFLERRGQLTPEARHHLALELASRLWPKVSGPPQGMHPEAFLLELAAAKASRA